MISFIVSIIGFRELIYAQETFLPTRDHLQSYNYWDYAF